MTIYKVLEVQIPEDITIIKVSEKDFRKFLHGQWHDAVIFETEKEFLSFDSEGKRLIIGVKDAKK